jgi:hypothetical protein
MIRGKITSIEWWRDPKNNEPLLACLIRVELTTGKRQDHADKAFIKIKEGLGKNVTLILD